MSEDYSCHVTINNRTSNHVRFLKFDLPWGKFKNDPVQDIEPGRETVAFMAQGAFGSPSGTEGTVWYQIGDDANNRVSIYWDVPWAPGTSNTFKVDVTNPDMAAMTSGFSGAGNSETVTIRLAGG